MYNHNSIYIARFVHEIFRPFTKPAADDIKGIHNFNGKVHTYNALTYVVHTMHLHT